MRSKGPAVHVTIMFWKRNRGLKLPLTGRINDPTLGNKFVTLSRQARTSDGVARQGTHTMQLYGVEGPALPAAESVLCTARSGDHSLIVQMLKLPLT